jgi:hypothetical protein
MQITRGNAAVVAGTGGRGFGAAINDGLNPLLVRSTFDSFHPDAIEGHSRLGPGGQSLRAMLSSRL